MSDSKIPPLQPNPSGKKKRKYMNWDKQADGGLLLKRASRRSSIIAMSMLAANASKKDDAISSDNVPLPACVSSQLSQTPITSSSSGQQSQTPVNSLSYLHSGQQSQIPITSSGQQSQIPITSSSFGQQSQTPVNSSSYLHSGQHSQIPITSSSGQQSQTPEHSSSYLHSGQQSQIPITSSSSGQQSQTHVNSSSYLHSGDNQVCEYCGSLFWHGERVTSFSTKHQPKYIRCCKGSTGDTVPEESCSGSTHTKQRLCSGQGSGESVHQSGSNELADEVSTKIHNHIVPYVNKLHDHRNKGQNAVFFDGQDRVVKVVSFVSSLLDNIKKPILIITSSIALSLWKMEF